MQLATEVWQTEPWMSSCFVPVWTPTHPCISQPQNFPCTNSQACLQRATRRFAKINTMRDYFSDVCGEFYFSQDYPNSAGKIFQAYVEMHEYWSLTEWGQNFNKYRLSEGWKWKKKATTYQCRFGWRVVFLALRSHENSTWTNRRATWAEEKCISGCLAWPCHLPLSHLGWY